MGMFLIYVRTTLNYLQKNKMVLQFISMSLKLVNIYYYSEDLTEFLEIFDAFLEIL